MLSHVSLPYICQPNLPCCFSIWCVFDKIVAIKVVVLGSCCCIVLFVFNSPLSFPVPYSLRFSKRILKMSLSLQAQCIKIILSHRNHWIYFAENHCFATASFWETIHSLWYLCRNISYKLGSDLFRQLWEVSRRQFQKSIQTHVVGSYPLFYCKDSQRWCNVKKASGIVTDCET